jgi:hypothetical protein
MGEFLDPASPAFLSTFSILLHTEPKGRAEPRALIQQWLGSPALALVPQPVQRFLQFGDEMAVK